MKRLLALAWLLALTGCHHDRLLTGCEVMALKPDARHAYYERITRQAPDPIPYQDFEDVAAMLCRRVRADSGGNVRL